jgi:hypothetical protein
MGGLLQYVGSALAISLSFLVLRLIYRVTLHPLASFPGPKLAGATSLYQAWFDLRPSTSYVKEFPALHLKYGRLESIPDLSLPAADDCLQNTGPIIRIAPNQLHIFDMTAYNT